MEKDFIVVVGSCNVDLTCYLDRMPRVGETVYGESFHQRFGGKGANQAVAALKLGAPVHMVAKLGDDHYGKDYLELFNGLGANTEAIQIVPSVTTGIAQITVDRSGDNRIIILPGANKHLTPSDLEDSIIRNLLCRAKVGLFQFEIETDTTKKAMELMKTFGNGTIILNCAPAIPGDKDIHSLADILILNETEVFGTVGLPVDNLSDVGPAMKKMFELGSNIIIITLGSRGAVFATRDEPAVNYVHVAVEPIENPIDTTGAGDAFCGALAFTFLKFKDIPLFKKIKFSCFVASYSVMKPGTHESFPSEVIVNQFYEKTMSD